MFRQKTLDVITLFHKPSVSASNRVLTLLKQGSAQAQETATEDQASDHSHQNAAIRREPFELDVTEAVPTEDQLRSISEYLGGKGIASVVEGASSVSDAARKLASDEGAFKRPVVVDWNQGAVVVGDNESQIMKMIREAPGQSQDAAGASTPKPESQKA